MSAENIEINEDNYFEIGEALHTVLTLWHDGGRGYELLCRSQYRPGLGYSESEVEENNEYFAEIENLLTDENGKFTSYDEIEKLMDKLDEYLEGNE